MIQIYSVHFEHKFQREKKAFRESVAGLFLHSYTLSCYYEHHLTISSKDLSGDRSSWVQRTETASLFVRGLKLHSNVSFALTNRVREQP